MSTASVALFLIKNRSCGFSYKNNACLVNKKTDKQKSIKMNFLDFSSMPVSVCVCIFNLQNWHPTVHILCFSIVKFISFCLAAGGNGSGPTSQRKPQ